MPSHWKNLLFGASLANIALLQVWTDALTYRRSDEYLMQLPPSPAQYGALLANLGLLAIGFALLAYWAGRSRVGRCVFIVSLALPIKTVHALAIRFLPYGDWREFLSGYEYVVELGILVLILALGIAWSDVVFRLVRSGFLLLTPFIAVIVIQGVWAAAHYDDREFIDGSTVPPLHAQATRRVVWIVFDALGQRLAFDQRASGLEMPEFDRFRATALYATAAYPPADLTLQSLPSLLTGRNLASAGRAGSRDLRIVYASPGGQSEVQWGEQPNVFSQARDLGVDSTLVGWFHPYCRMLHQSLTSCWWSAYPFQLGSVRRNFAGAVPDYLRGLFETDLYSPFGQTLPERVTAERHLALLPEAIRAVRTQSTGLVFLHLPAPHGPHVYNRQTGKFTRSHWQKGGYTDSLALADLILGQLRREMEAVSLWDSTAILVSSDHYEREDSPATGTGNPDHRVPFLLKLAGQRNGTVFTPKFNTVVSADLVLAILEGKLTSKEQAVEWLSLKAQAPPE